MVKFVIKIIGIVFILCSNRIVIIIKVLFVMLNKNIGIKMLYFVMCKCIVIGVCVVLFCINLLLVEVIVLLLV